MQTTSDIAHMMPYVPSPLFRFRVSPRHRCSPHLFALCPAPVLPVTNRKPFPDPFWMLLDYSKVIVGLFLEDSSLPRSSFYPPNRRFIRRSTAPPLSDFLVFPASISLCVTDSRFDPPLLPAPPRCSAGDTDPDPLSFLKAAFVSLLLPSTRGPRFFW